MNAQSNVQPANPQNPLLMYSARNSIAAIPIITEPPTPDKGGGL